MRTWISPISEFRIISRGDGQDTCRAHERGFTMVEVLAVVVLLALAAAAVGSLAPKGSARAEFRAATGRIASRLRDVRAAAILGQSQRSFFMDVDRRLAWADDGGPSLELGRNMRLTVKSAYRMRRGTSLAGFRFYPNGSSTGGTIAMSHGPHAAEITVNWLTGRVTQREIR